MKTSKIVPATFSLLLGCWLATSARAQDSANAPSAAKPEAAPAETKPADAKPADGPATTADKPLRLNFRNAPLEMVLNYLSEAAGFIIVPETEIRGKIDVWSNQPVTQDEAMAILDSALSKNGLTAMRNGRTLTIVSKESAKRRDIPVKRGNDPDEIPKNEELVTQIIPIHFITAAQLVQNLQPLLPTGSEMTANEAGNALVLTDTQTSIKRMTEIIRALDTSMAGATTIKVFPLRYADAKELATLVKELFPSQNGAAGGNNNNRGGGGFPGFGGGGFPGFGGGNNGGNNAGGRGAGGTSGSGNRAAASRVTAVADEHSNSLVVNAPEDVLPAIAELVKSVDKDVEDITEVRAFRLKYADPVEMATLLTSLFPDETQNSGSGNNVQFGGGRGGGFGGFGGGRATGNAAGGDSDLAKKKGKVLAVPDQRTGSVIVKAARDLMGQIAQMVQQLDSDPAKKQKVYVYELDNADPTEVETVLRSLFENQNTQNRNTRNNQNQNSALTTRQTQNQNQNRTTTGGFGQGGGQGGGGLGGR